MCNLVRCPSCHYEFAESYPRVSWLRRLLSRAPVSLADNLPTEVQPVSELSFGTQAEVLCVGGSGNGRQDRLAVFGLAPGAEITVIQQTPSCVLKIDETELALDPEIAAQILVRVSATEDDR